MLYTLQLCNEFVTIIFIYLVAGTHDSLLALFLISLGVKFARKIKIDCKFKVLTKKEITDSFILHVQVIMKFHPNKIHYPDNF